jgi:hypothetical protein
MKTDDDQLRIAYFVDAYEPDSATPEVLRLKESFAAAGWKVYYSDDYRLTYLDQIDDVVAKCLASTDRGRARTHQFLFYFFGHGSLWTFKGDSSVGGTSLSELEIPVLRLDPAISAPSMVEQTSIYGFELQQKLEELRELGFTVTAILDSCYSGEGLSIDQRHAVKMLGDEPFDDMKAFPRLKKALDAMCGPHTSAVAEPGPALPPMHMLSAATALNTAGGAGSESAPVPYLTAGLTRLQAPLAITAKSWSSIFWRLQWFLKVKHAAPSYASLQGDRRHRFNAPPGSGPGSRDCVAGLVKRETGEAWLLAGRLHGIDDNQRVLLTIDGKERELRVESAHDTYSIFEPDVALRKSDEPMFDARVLSSDQQRSLNLYKHLHSEVPLRQGDVSVHYELISEQSARRPAYHGGDYDADKDRIIVKLENRGESDVYVHLAVWDGATFVLLDTCLSEGHLKKGSRRTLGEFGGRQLPAPKQGDHIEIWPVVSYGRPIDMHIGFGAYAYSRSEVGIARPVGEEARDNDDGEPTLGAEARAVEYFERSVERLPFHVLCVEGRARESPSSRPSVLNLGARDLHGALVFSPSVSFDALLGVEEESLRADCRKFVQEKLHQQFTRGSRDEQAARDEAAQIGAPLVKIISESPTTALHVEIVADDEAPARAQLEGLLDLPWAELGRGLSVVVSVVTGDRRVLASRQHGSRAPAPEAAVDGVATTDESELRGASQPPGLEFHQYRRVSLDKLRSTLALDGKPDPEPDAFVSSVEPLLTSEPILRLQARLEGAEAEAGRQIEEITRFFELPWELVWNRDFLVLAEDEGLEIVREIVPSAGARAKPRATAEGSTILHLTCHGTDQGELVFEGLDIEERHRADELVDALAAFSSVRLVFLVSCNGQGEPEHWTSHAVSPAVHLAKSGKVEVMAYAGEVKHDLARRVNTLFYRALPGSTTRAAIARLRRDLAEHGRSYSFAWAAIGFYATGTDTTWTLEHQPRSDDIARRSPDTNQFWGRRWLLANLRERVLEHGWVGLYGLDGFGKTTTLHELARILHEHGVCKQDRLVVDFGYDSQAQYAKQRNFFQRVLKSDWELLRERLLVAVSRWQAAHGHKSQRAVLNWFPRNGRDLAREVSRSFGQGAIIFDNVQVFAKLRGWRKTETKPVKFRSHEVHMFFKELIRLSRVRVKNGADDKLFVLIGSRVKIATLDVRKFGTGSISGRL